MNIEIKLSINPKMTGVIVVLFVQIAVRPAARYLKCLFRFVFVPLDVCELLIEDTTSFDYFYAQVVGGNDKYTMILQKFCCYYNIFQSRKNK